MKHLAKQDKLMFEIIEKIVMVMSEERTKLKRENLIHVLWMWSGYFLK